MFAGIDDVDVEAVTAAVGEIEVAASGPWNCRSAPSAHEMERIGALLPRKEL
ncbi:hypothetical protein [Streptomyces sp. NPDC090445]|uniref:hypothetical protein n=1 Tax=Streptomyces sp. NPDC090445 TaxID=3365963 RepID=UPI00382DEED2